VAIACPASGYYEETHVTGDDVRVSVDTNGAARIEHVVSWHLVAGQIHFLDVSVADPALSPELQASVTAEDGRVTSATLIPHEGNVLRVAFEEPKGLRHGRYKVRFAYRVDLASSHAFARDGAMWRLSWASPTFSDGYDGARVTFDLPSSVDKPRLADLDVDPGILSTVRVAEDRDEIELVKPHVARREALTWAIRVAPRAFPGVRDPSLRPPAVRPPVVVRPSVPPVLVALGALTAGLLYAWLAWSKIAGFDRACREHGVAAEGLLRLRPDMRAALAGACVGAGVLVEAEGAPTWGGICIAAAMLVAASRAPIVRAAPRGPGRWLAIRPADAFGPGGARGFSLGTLRTVVVGLLAAGSLVGAALLLRRLAPHAPFVVALDALAVVPLIATGRPSQLPPSPHFGAPWLERLFQRLSREKSLRVAPWARVPTGCTDPDEVRVLVLPRAAMPGLAGIEVGLVSWPSVTCYGRAPEVLVRVHESTAASARMTTLAARVRPVPGRVPEERVYRLVPRIPTKDGTALLVRRLGRELEDRRMATLPWDREERRLPPSAHEKPLARAA
jgi:hypothetical protein